MKRVILNALCAFILMLIQTNVSSAFGIQMVCQFCAIAALLTGALSMPMMSSAISILVLAVICDLFVSGPIGIYAFCLMVTFGIARALLSRFRYERVFALMIWSCILCILFESLQATLYSLYYLSTQYWVIFAQFFWKDAIATTIATPVVMWLILRLERLMSRRHTTGLT